MKPAARARTAWDRLSTEAQYRYVLHLAARERHLVAALDYALGLLQNAEIRAAEFRTESDSARASLAEAVERIESTLSCPTCDGTGWGPDGIGTDCPDCDGTGKRYQIPLHTDPASEPGKEQP